MAAGQRSGDSVPEGEQEKPTVNILSEASEEVRSELQDFLYTQAQRRQVFPRALLVGLAVGAVALAFRAALTGGDLLRSAILSSAHRLPYIGWIVPVLFSALCAGVSVALVRRFAPEASGSGIPHLEAVLRRYRTLRGPRVLSVKFIGGTLALGAGMALGREGPTVQMGASVADIIASRLRVSHQERMTLLAAGAGAGLAAAFNAPLAGLIFVLEEVQRDFRPIVFGAAFVAAACADVLARSLTGQLPVFSVPSYPVPSLLSLPAFLILGAVAGGLGILFNRGLLRVLTLFSRIPARFAVSVAAAVGGGIGLIGWFSPDALGGGHHLAESAMAGRLSFAALPLWFLLRFGMTMASYGCGAPGGIFAPLLAMGALIGLGVGHTAQMIAPTTVLHPEIFAVVGMAAYFTAIVRAPLTGVVLILEMTGNYGQMLPLIVACFAAYAVAEFLNDRPIYEALLERDLARTGTTDPNGPNEGNRVMEFTVQPGSSFAGKYVRDLGLPPGCILVSGRNDQGEWIPGGNTRLQAEDRITAVISPEAEEAISLLREGCMGHLE